MDARVTEAYENLKDSLDELQQAYQGLLSTILLEKKFLLNSQIEDLKELNLQKESLLSAIKHKDLLREKQALQLARDLKLNSGQFRLLDLAKGLPAAEAEVFRQFHQRLNSLVERVVASKYVEAHTDKSAQGLVVRCRLKYLELCRAHAELIFLLIDQSEAASFVKGKALLEDCSNLAAELMTAVASVEDPWAVVSFSSIGESGSAERSSSFGSMAGVLALNLDNLNHEETMIAGLLSDVGLLDLSPKTLKKMRGTGLGSLSSEELISYHQHPIASVNRCLSRRLPLPEKVKNIMMATHEQTNAKGFPKKLIDHKIPVESMVIRFCQMVDEGLTVKMGQMRREVKEVQKEIIDREINSRENFSIDLLYKIKAALGFKN